MKLIIKKGKTSFLALVYIEDGVTHLGKAGLVAADVTAAYARADQADTAGAALVLGTGTRGTWSSGGFKEKDATALPGWYELGLPNAMLATGSDWAILELKDAASNGIVFPQKTEIQLVNFDPDDTIRLGLTALPNAAAEAAGGLFTQGTGAGQIHQNATGQIDTNTVAMATDVVAAAAVKADAVTKIAGGVLSNTSNLLVTDSSGRVSLHGNIIKNQALANFEFFMTDAVDHVTGKTGLSVVVARSIDGGAFAASTNTPATEIANGMYKISLSAADLNGNVIAFKFTAAGADTRVVVIVTNP